LTRDISVKIASTALIEMNKLHHILKTEDQINHLYIVIWFYL